MLKQANTFLQAYQCSETRAPNAKKRNTTKQNLLFYKDADEFKDNDRIIEQHNSAFIKGRGYSFSSN